MAQVESRNAENLKRGEKPLGILLQSNCLHNGEANQSERFADVDWDLIITDEARGKSQTELSDTVMKELVKEHTKILELSEPLHLSGSI